MTANRCTPQQQQVIDTLDRALMVSAGAGSGKTFTLTQRIAAAFDCRQGTALLDDIGQVLAITYTKKAAAELKGRIKAKLIADGLRDQARTIDDAWVCTIHAMAGRMLRENALRIGLDPAFKVLDETEADILWNQAVEMVAAEISASDDPLIRRILADEKLTAPKQGRSLLGDAQAILERVHAMPEGFAGVEVPPVSADAHDILRAFSTIATELTELIESWSQLSNKDRAVLDALSCAQESAAAWIADEPSDPADAAFDSTAFMDVIHSFPPTTPAYGAKKEGAERIASYRSEYARLFEEARAAVALPSVRFKVSVAQHLDETYRALKGPSRLDNDDLLRECYRALSADETMALRYRTMFRLIMIDEFQDTDRLQTAIIECIAQDGFANVCTVGDAQQSIYRFRGADVNVFEGYRAALFASSDEAVAVELPDNFRSHGDILKFVDVLFSRSEMFGEAFLHLEPKGAINDLADPVFDELPRVELALLHYRNSGSKPRMSIDEVRAHAAARIAHHFSELAAAGVPARDMALLLGSMAHASVYAEALRAVGLPSMTVAGSTFTTSAEASLAATLLQVARNRRDDQAVLAALISPLFNITDDALLMCASRREDGVCDQRSVAAGLFDPDEHLFASLHDDARTMFALARDALSAFVRRARRQSAAEALRTLLVESGALDRAARAGQAGLAFAGNMEKACRLIASLEEECGGIAELSARFDAHLRLAQERPGLLVAQDAEFVTLMTVHGSKGLEFPHVAIAEMRAKDRPPDIFIAENVGEHTYVAGLCPADSSRRTAYNNIRAFARHDEPRSADACETVGQRYRSLSVFAADQQAQEAKRLLYVALTRAVKSVMLMALVPEDPAAGYRGAPILRELHEALAWPLDAVRSVSSLEFGGQCPARVSLEYLPDSLAASADEDEGAQVTREPTERSSQVFEVPIRADVSQTMCFAGSLEQRRTWSYTSLSPEFGETIAVPGEEEAAAQEQLWQPREERATDLGIAFHRLAQQALVVARAEGSCVPRMPSDTAVRAQVLACNLSDAAATRLSHALARWFGSRVAKAFFAFEDKAAEVPFAVKVSSGAASFFLVGEIDGLAVEGVCAHLIDYKTGGAGGQSADELYRKHLFQAQCYAYALLCNGYERIQATFVRVEQADPLAPEEPQTVEYAFTTSDLDALRMRICAAHRSVTGHE
ncbi:UvrD-helicase domain-containing protein [Adlercreutzia murintestinalis]|uniref:UvrD-helicase domain-containing protein n=1 Tax=Adlercreutzia murintestinalis TaxID=2941325 RepID=UPI0020401429|nr:UvrD-helicase domain-containing protein [Adlercreutzia murintestinalis]